MSKIISQGSEYKTKIKKGIDTVYELVSGTLGPYGYGVALDRGFSVPLIADDGVSIVRAIELDDDIERQGMAMIKEVASKTNEQAGDGTTTSIVLAHSLITEGLKYSENPIEIRRLLEKAKNKVVDELKKIAKPIKTDKEILEIATISAGSEELGQQIAMVFKSVGKDGIVSVEEGKLPDTQVSTVDGYEVERGFISPYMQNKENKAEFSKTRVMVIGEKLSSVAELLPILNKLIEKGIREFVIFCPDMDIAIVNMLLLNKQQGIFNCLAVKADSQKNEILEDIALVTGAKLISKSAGFKLEDIKIDDLGEAERITSSKDKTIIINGKGKVKDKITELKFQLISNKNENEYDLIEQRIGRLKNNIAVISVGARTETEMRDKYLKTEDAVNSVKSALEEGIVEGGGMTLYKISKMLDDKDIGERIMKAALHSPIKKIIENCGQDYADIMMAMPKGMGYNAQNNSYVDMLKEGIIDPVKVERCCLENAVSFAGTFLTSKACIATKTEKKDE